MIFCTFELTIPDAKADSLYGFVVQAYDKGCGEWQLEDDFFFSITTYGKENHFSDAILAVEYLGENRRIAFNGRRVSFFGVVLRKRHSVKLKGWAKNINIRIPMIMELELYTTDEGALAKHKLCFGYLGIGRLLNPLIKLYCNKSFCKGFKEHCEMEWLKLAERLAGIGSEI